MRVELRMRVGYSFWAKTRENDYVIDIQGLLDDYWSSDKREFTVLSQSRSPTRPSISDIEPQGPLPSGNTLEI